MNRFKNLLSEPLINKVLSSALQYGGEFAEIYAQDSAQTVLNLQESEIRSSEFRTQLGVGIRVIIGEQTGYAYTDILTEESLLTAAKTAGKIASAGGGAHPSPLQSIQFERRYSDKGVNADTKLKADLLLRADKTARAEDSRILEVTGSYVDEIKHIIIVNSEGLFAEDVQPMTRIMVGATAVENGRAVTGMYGAGGRTDFSYYETNTPEDIAKEAVRQAIVQVGAGEAPAGTMPVVIGNGWGGVMLHEAVGHGLEADFNRKGTSLYSGRIGEKVASELCTVIDDGTIANRRGSINIDDEGCPSERTVLIENGVLVQYMNDKLNAKLMKSNRTGNGRRQNYTFSPVPRMTNTYLQAGTSEPAEIISGVKKGFYAKFLGGGQVNITNGNFVFEVTEGYLIENGKVTAPVRGATLIGNGPDILTKVAMVGKDQSLDNGMGSCGKDGQFVPVGVGLPTVLISEMTVGGAGIE